MADAVTTRIVFEDAKQYVIHMTSVSDATGESSVKKVDIATVTPAVGGAQPVSLDIERVEYSIKTFVSVIIAWDHTTDDTALVLPGGLAPVTGCFTFTASGWPTSGSHPGLIGSQSRNGSLKDPRSSGGDGSILLTSSATAGGTYDILLWLYKNPS